MIKTIALRLEPVKLLHHHVVIGPPTAHGVLNTLNVLHIIVDVAVHGREEVCWGHRGHNRVTSLVPVVCADWHVLGVDGHMGHADRCEACTNWHDLLRLLLTSFPALLGLHGCLARLLAPPLVTGHHAR